jgi:hypothetical protein
MFHQLVGERMIQTIVNEQDNIQETLVNMPPTLRQRRSALVVAAVLTAAVAALVPFVDTPLPQHEGFITVLVTAVFITDFITSIMLFWQLAIYRSRALLVACERLSLYRIDCHSVCPHFPRCTFASRTVRRERPNLTVALQILASWFSHCRVDLRMAAGERPPKKTTTRISPPLAVGISVAIVVALVFALAWITIAESAYLPTVFLDNRQYPPHKLSCGIQCTD